jgi:hypothetical protein
MIMQRTYGYELFEREVNASNSWEFQAKDHGILLWLHLEYNAVSGGGNRQIKLSMLTAAEDLIVDIHAGAVQAGNSQRHYLFLPGAARDTSFLLDELQVPIPTEFYFRPGRILRIEDLNADSPTDSMVISHQWRKVAR